MNLRPGSAVGMSFLLKTMNDNYMFHRFAAHDTAYLIQLMGGNVMSY